MITRILIKTLQVFFVRGFGAAVGFLLTLAVTNLTSSHESGLFFLCIALVFVGARFVLIGSPQAIVRVVGANSEENWRVINLQISVILNIVFFLCLCTIIIFTVFSSAIADLMFQKAALAVLLPTTAIGVLFFALVQIFSSALQGKHNTVLASTVQNVIMPLCFMFGVAVTLLFVGSISAKDLLRLYVAGLSISAFMGFYIWMQDHRSALTIQTSFPKELRASLYPLFIVTCMQLCVQWSGQFATAHYLEVNEIAFFAAAQRTALLAGFVLVAVNLIVEPRFANAFGKGLTHKVNKLSLLSSRLMICLAAPVLALMLLFPQHLMLLFGEEYVVAVPLLQIMAVGQFINVLTGSVASLLIMTSHEKDFRNVVLISGPLAIILAIVLTNEFGLIGAAYATAISSASQSLFCVYMVKKRLGFNPINVFRRV